MRIHHNPGRRQLAGIPVYTFTLAVVMLGATLPTPMYHLYGEQLGFSVLTTTVVFATYTAAVLAALLFFGRWSDVIGRRPVLVAAAALAIASSLVFLGAGTVAELLVGRALSGLSAGIVTGTATAAILESGPPQHRARNAAVAAAANLGGLGAGPVLAGLLIHYAPAPLHLSFTVHLGLVVFAVVAVLLTPETSPCHGRLGWQRLSVPGEARAVFAVAAAAAFAAFAVNGLFASVAPLFVSSLMGIHNEAVGGAVAGSMIVTAAVVQPVATLIRPHRAVVAGCALLVVAMIVLMAALRFANLPGLIAAAVLAGTGQGLGFGRGLAAVSDRTPPERRAEVSSAYFLVAYLAVLLPVVGFGAAAQAWGLQRAGEAFAAIVGVLAVACLTTIAVQQRRPAPAP